MTNDKLNKAITLVEALPYIKRFAGANYGHQIWWLINA